MAGINVINLNNSSNDNSVTDAYLTRLGYKQAGIDLQTDLFANITFPSLPNNFETLMSDLQMPEKFRNINGLLYVKPHDIDANPANDIALQCFGRENLSKSKITGTIDTEGTSNESLTFDKMIIKMLFEDTGDPALGDSNIEPKDERSRNEKMSNVNMTIAHAITDYVNRSISIIKPLLEMVAGQEGKTLVKKIAKDIQNANSAQFENVKDFLKSHSDIEKERERYNDRKEIEDLRNGQKYKMYAYNVIMCMELKLGNSAEDLAFKSKIRKSLNRIETIKDLDSFVDSFCTDYDDYKSFERDFTNHQEKPFEININNNETVHRNETIEYKGKNMLVEDAINMIFEDDSSNDIHTEAIDYDAVYENLVSYLTNSISEAIGPRQEWLCMKKTEEGMKYIKDKCNEEILAKIDEVCGTKQGSSNDSKKHLFLKGKNMPYKAAGLKNMWARYDSELQTRMEMRINQLTGSAGGVSSGAAQFVEDFLRNTYVKLIAVMLTYKLLFQQLSFQYKKGHMTHYTLEQRTEIAQLLEGNDQSYRLLIDSYNRAVQEGNAPA